MKWAFARSLVALGLALAVVSGAHAAGVAPPTSPAPLSSLVEGAKFCPVHIFCRKGTVARCAVSPITHRCACRCVKRHL